MWLQRCRHIVIYDGYRERLIFVGRMANVSILILTLNEAVNLADCLASCAWGDDVVVFDSHSSDATVDIARQYGARVYQRVFDDYAAQRNAALQDVQYRHPWVLMLDADERVPLKLAEEIQQMVTTASADITLCRMRRKDYFFGRWLRRSSGYPTWFGRLVRPDRTRVEREINEEYVTDGQVVLLQHHLEHHPFNRGIAHWYERHNRYSTLEAVATVNERRQTIQWHKLLHKDPVQRRRCLKRIAYRIPARPLMTFIYLYVVRLGVLDGLPGLHYSAMRATYELMIDLKVREIGARTRYESI